MATLLGKSFPTDENDVVQDDFKLIGSMIKLPLVEFGQGKFEKFLSLGSKSPKAPRQYRKVSSETRY